MSHFDPRNVLYIVGAPIEPAGSGQAVNLLLGKADSLAHYRIAKRGE